METCAIFRGSLGHSFDGLGREFIVPVTLYFIYEYARLIGKRLHE